MLTFAFPKYRSAMQLLFAVVACAVAITAEAAFEMAPGVDIQSAPGEKAAPVSSPKSAEVVPAPAAVAPTPAAPTAPLSAPAPVNNKSGDAPVAKKTFVPTKADWDAAAPADEKSAPAAQECWFINPNQQKLSTVMDQWSQKAGWQMIWESKKDFPIEVSATLCSSFQDAVKTVLESYRNSDAPIKAKFYRGNNVVRFVSGAK